MMKCAHRLPDSGCHADYTCVWKLGCGNFRGEMVVANCRAAKVIQGATLIGRKLSRRRFGNENIYCGRSPLSNRQHAILEMTSAHLDHGLSMATSETTVGGGGGGADSGGEKSLLTSPEESVLEKSSPEPASIHSDGANGANLAENEAETEKDGDKKLRTLDSNDPDAEPVYPKMVTKVLVGVGLALAVFLVPPTPASPPQ